jgi:hypothetical protein
MGSEHIAATVTLVLVVLTVALYRIVEIVTSKVMLSSIPVLHYLLPSLPADFVASLSNVFERTVPD